MPSVVKLASLARSATLPETRRLVARAVRSGAVTDTIRRARTDRMSLIRDLGDPRAAPGRIREAIGHPATRELANLGLLLLPGRYVPVGWAAAWLARRLGLSARGSDPNASDATSVVVHERRSGASSVGAGEA